jgi:hypothetical protein
MIFTVPALKMIFPLYSALVSLSPRGARRS